MGECQAVQRFCAKTQGHKPKVVHHSVNRAPYGRRPRYVDVFKIECDLCEATLMPGSFSKRETAQGFIDAGAWKKEVR
jgi:hypothetical protein